MNPAKNLPDTVFRYPGEGTQTMLLHKHHIPIDGRQILRAAHGHGVAQLRADLLNVKLHAFLSAAVDHGNERPADEHRVGAQCQRLEYVHAAADAAVHEDLYAVCPSWRPRCPRGLRRWRRTGPGRGRRGWLTTMAAAPASLAFQCPRHGHDALDDEGLSDHSGDLGAAPPRSCCPPGASCFSGRAAPPRQCPWPRRSSRMSRQ